jgi:hypothetical protein
MANDVDGLYQLPPGEFTAARNALAAVRRKAGRRDEAGGIKALPRPSITAWVVNTLFWKHRKAFDRLLASGEGLRRAQVSRLSGRSTDLRGSLGAHRDALTGLSRLAADVLLSAGHQPAPDLMRRITTTLEALSTTGSAPDAPAPGRLADDVQPKGFDTLAALVPRAGALEGTPGGRSAIIPFRQRTRPADGASPAPARNARAMEQAREQARRAARAAQRAAEEALREARAVAARAEAAHKQMAKRVSAAEAVRAGAEARLDEATADLATVRQEARRMAAAAAEAAAGVADAERALEQARRKD